MNAVFITGGTGFVGSALCMELLKNHKNYIYILARGKGKESAGQRVRRHLDKIGAMTDYSSRIRVIDGDLTSVNLGVEAELWNELKKNITAIYHCAASVKFSLSYELAEKINCYGTRTVIKLLHEAEHPNFDRLHYVSTAYIAGNISSGFSEDDLRLGQQFNNTYEVTKFNCEELLQEEMTRGYPITIYRPSIITSSSIDGSSHKNCIIQKFVKMFKTGRITQFFCDENASLNLVPINYFIEGMLELGKRKNTLMNTYHLVNEKNANVREMIRDYCEEMNVKIPEFISCSESYGKEDDRFAYFSDYIRLSHCFAAERTRDILCDAGIKCGKVDKEHVRKNIEFSKAHGFI